MAQAVVANRNWLKPECFECLARHRVAHPRRICTAAPTSEHRGRSGLQAVPLKLLLQPLPLRLPRRVFFVKL